jgi:hypothetical protein
MSPKRVVSVLVLVLGVSLSPVWADQLMLKNGREYSGKFVRADASVVEFRILGRIESFRTSEVSQIVFKEPELINPPSSASSASTTAAAPVEPVRPPTPSAGTVRDPQPDRGVERSAQTARDAAPDVRTEPLPAQQVPPAASGPSSTFPSGTPIVIRMSETIDTDRNRVGDTFNATLEEPLVLDNQTLVPRGAEVKGNIALAQESGRLSGQSELILELNEIRVNGRTYPIRTSDYTEIGSSRGKRTAAAAGGGAALGAIIGAIAGGGKGAAVGAATGAAVGTGVQVLTKGQTLKVPVETVLEFRLQHPLTVDVP